MEKVIKVTIGTKGEVGVEAMEGFVGEGCQGVTKGIAIALGGMREKEDVKKDAFYDSDDSDCVRISNDL